MNQVNRIGQIADIVEDAVRFCRCEQAGQSRNEQDDAQPKARAVEPVAWTKSHYGECGNGEAYAEIWVLKERPSSAGSHGKMTQQEEGERRWRKCVSPLLMQTGTEKRDKRSPNDQVPPSSSAASAARRGKRSTRPNVQVWCKPSGKVKILAAWLAERYEPIREK